MMKKQKNHAPADYGGGALRRKNVEIIESGRLVFNLTIAFRGWGGMGEPIFEIASRGLRFACPYCDSNYIGLQRVMRLKPYD